MIIFHFKHTQKTKKNNNNFGFYEVKRSEPCAPKLIMKRVKTQTGSGNHKGVLKSEASPLEYTIKVEWSF